MESSFPAVRHYDFGVLYLWIYKTDLEYSNNQIQYKKSKKLDFVHCGVWLIMSDKIGLNINDDFKCIRHDYVHEYRQRAIRGS